MLLGRAELGGEALAKVNECSLECVDLSHPPTSFTHPHRALMDAPAHVWGEDPGMGVATSLDMEGPQWEAPQVQRFGRCRIAGEGERQWTTPLPYEIEQSLLFLIDEGGWMLRHGRS